MSKGIIYYTDNRLTGKILEWSKKTIKDSGLPITSASLQPIDFGNNEVLHLTRSYPTMVRQILSCLERSKEDYVFFCEHDVLYPKDHFDFTPPTDDIFYYNENIWRWDFYTDKAITYDRLISLSCMCCNRELALKHYRLRLEKIIEMKLDEDRSREPRFGRVWGYEPGTKKKRRGGFTDDDFATWRSATPIIDIRHGLTFSKSKVTRESFKHPPSPDVWKETTVNKIAGWDLKEMFNL